jgi:hypothetical protein
VATPAIVSYLHGRPYGVVSFHVVDGRVRNIYIISNPDKLAGLPTLASSVARGGQL